MPWVFDFIIRVPSRAQGWILAPPGVASTGEASLTENHKSAGLCWLLMQPNSADPELFVRPGCSRVHKRGCRGPRRVLSGGGGSAKPTFHPEHLECVFSASIDLPACPSPLTLVHHSSLPPAPGGLLRCLGQKGGTGGLALVGGGKLAWPVGLGVKPTSHQLAWRVEASHGLRALRATKPPPRAPGPSACLLLLPLACSGSVGPLGTQPGPKPSPALGLIPASSLVPGSPAWGCV